MTLSLKLFTQIVTISLFAITPILFSYPQTAKVALDKAYVPIGFDDNDRVQVMVVGSFSDTCHRVGKTRVEVDERKRELRISQFAYRYESDDCRNTKVSFSSVVSVGLMRMGQYTIVDNTTGRTIGRLPISRSNHSGPDDFTYAPIEDAYLIVDAYGNKGLTLRGRFSDRCTDFEDIKINYYPDVIVVQPVTERSSGVCEERQKLFFKTIPLNASLNGSYLLHVRSLNGQAINKLVDTRFLEE